jgi:hypothetical protein
VSAVSAVSVQSVEIVVTVVQIVAIVVRSMVISTETTVHAQSVRRRLQRRTTSLRTWVILLITWISNQFLKIGPASSLGCGTI